MNILWILKSLKKNCLAKKKFIVPGLQTTRKITDKENGHALNVWNKFEMKKMNDFHHFI